MQQTVTHAIFTDRQHQIARLAVEGMTNEQIGTQLGISRLSVAQRMKILFDRSGMNGRLELALWYLHHFERHAVAA